METTGETKRRRLVARTLAKVKKAIDERMKAGDFKPTLGDYLKLLQLEQEIGEEPPKEIKVTWVEPPSEPEK
jgi:hypothetical protein